MTYVLHTPIYNNSWETALIYHAYLHNGDVPYDYSIGSHNPESQYDYENLVTWNDAATKPIWGDLTPLFPIALDWMIDNSRESLDNHLLEVYENHESGIELASTEILAHAFLIAGKMNTPSGSTSQYIRGDGSIVSFPTIPSITPQTHIADADTDAPDDAITNYNVVTTLLGALTSAVNAANAKQNTIATNLNDLAEKYNTLLDRLEANSLLAAS